MIKQTADSKKWISSPNPNTASKMAVENGGDDKKPMMRRTSIDSLSDDDLITILVKLPAQDIHDVGRLVCRRWYRLISSPEFIHTHLQSSPAGILIQCKSNDDDVRSEFVGMNQKGRIETCYKLRYNFNDTVLSSCNGLVLFGDHDLKTLFVVNPVTKQQFLIPDLFGEGILDKCFMCLGYVEASKEYKVVMVKNQKECGILTVGVDDLWRPLPTDHLSDSILHKPVVTEGFVHWVDLGTTGLVTLNLETETISDIPLPPNLGWCHCLSAGKCLSFISISQLGLCWDLWEMTPGPVQAEWDQWTHIDLADKVRTHENLSSIWDCYCFLLPVGWIKYKEVLLFIWDGRPTFVTYNLCTGELESFELDFPIQLDYHYVEHTNTLLWLDGKTHV